MRQTILSNRAGRTTTPLSHAVKIDGLIYTSGQLGRDPETGKIPEDFKEEVRLALTNIKNIIEDSGSNMDNVIKVNIYVTDINNVKELNEVYKTFFKEGNYPARCCVEVSKLALNARVEIEAIASWG